MEKDFLWIIDCLQSCNDEWQLNCCYHLQDLFQSKYREDKTGQAEKYRKHISDLYLKKRAEIDKIKIKKEAVIAPTLERYEESDKDHGHEEPPIHYLT